MDKHHRWTTTSWIGVAACAGMLWLPGCGGGSGDGGNADTSAVGSPIAWYRFEGNVTEDSSGFGHDGTCEGDRCPTSEPDGPVGAAGAFNGSTFVFVEDDGSLSTPDGYSVAAWARVDKLGQRVAVFTKTYRGGPKNSWAITIDADGFPFCFSSTRESSDTLKGDSPVELGRWYHYACTWDGTTKTFYIDGAKVAEDQAKSEFDLGQVVVGGDIDGDPGFGVEGMVDEAMLFDYALEPDQVRTIADMGTPPSGGGPSEPGDGGAPEASADGGTPEAPADGGA